MNNYYIRNDIFQLYYPSIHLWHDLSFLTAINLDRHFWEKRVKYQKVTPNPHREYLYTSCIRPYFVDRPPSAEQLDLGNITPCTPAMHAQL